MILEAGTLVSDSMKGSASVACPGPRCESTFHEGVTSLAFCLATAKVFIVLSGR